MNAFIAAKEQLTAFQRWELPSFDPVPITAEPLTRIEAPATAVSNVQTAAAQAAIEAAIEAATEAAAKIETAAKAEAAAAELKKCHTEAYDKGYSEGHQTGYTEGLQQGQTEAARIHKLLENLQIALTQTDEQLAQSLLNLSLEIAQKMVVDALKIKPEIILKVVGAAISSLPHFNHNAHLIMHPDDAELVRKQMGEELAHTGWKVFTDTKIEPGGCRIETAHSNIDATNTARWQNIVASIGQDKSWLMT